MIGVDAVANVIAVMLDEEGDNSNPTDGGSCLYTAVDDPNCHCVVGQYLKNIGRTVPGPEVHASLHSLIDEGYTELRDHTPDAISLLIYCQMDADEGGSERTWADVIDLDDNLKCLQSA